MQTSHYFESQIAKAEKKYREDSSFPLEQTIAESFLRATNLPKSMAGELFDDFSQNRDKLVSLVDFFNEPAAQNIDDLPFSREELFELSELANRFADELELEKLQDLYRFFMTHRLLKHQQKQE